MEPNEDSPKQSENRIKQTARRIVVKAFLLTLMYLTFISTNLINTSEISIDSINRMLVDAGAIFPIITLIATCLTEWEDDRMLTALRLQKIEDKAEARGEEKGKAEGIAEGKAEGINETVELFKQAGVDEETINKVIELAASTGIKTDKPNSSK